MNEVDFSALRHLRLPKVGQLGFVVRNIEQSLPYYSSIFNINTWYQPNYKRKIYWSDTDEFGPEINFVLAFSGKVQIELVETSFQKQNIFTEHIDKFGEGLHHLAFYVKNFDELVAGFKQLNIELLVTGELNTAAGGEVRIAYFDTYEQCGTIFEVLEVKFFGLILPQTRFFMNIARLSGDVSMIKG